MTFQFKIQINGITKPPVWRKVKVNSDSTFRDLHNVIQLAFGWTFSHLYLFAEKPFISDYQIEDPDFMDDEYGKKTDSTKVKLKDIFKKEKQVYTYVYDFGDNWEHKIILEKISDEKLKMPICLAGKGKCPPEDCGGTWGYEDIKITIKDTEHEEYEDLRMWLGLEEGENWDPNEFDLEMTNANLLNIKDL